MPLDDALHDGQADAGAFVFLTSVQSLEDPEQLAGILLIKSDAIILDVVDGFMLRHPPVLAGYSLAPGP